jgi:hypothetical protein
MHDMHRKQNFDLKSVEKADAPQGLPGDNWYRYVLECGDNTIEGHKPGTLRAVTQHAQEVADDLNERKDRKGSTYAPRAHQRKNR